MVAHFSLSLSNASRLELSHQQQNTNSEASRFMSEIFAELDKVEPDEAIVARIRATEEADLNTKSRGEAVFAKLRARRQNRENEADESRARQEKLRAEIEAEKAAIAQLTCELTTARAEQQQAKNAVEEKQNFLEALLITKKKAETMYATLRDVTDKTKQFVDDEPALI